MTQWQPIETAPKDGTRVLLFQKGRKIKMGEFIVCHNFWNASDFWKDTHGNELKPTHWMPLPPPPQEASQ